MSKRFFIFLLFALVTLAACKKVEPLPPLEATNPLDPGNDESPVVLDSCKVESGPFVKLYYHLNFDRLEVTNISKVVVFRQSGYNIELPLVSPYVCQDNMVLPFHTYVYYFGFKDKNGAYSAKKGRFEIYVPH